MTQLRMISKVVFIFPCDCLKHLVQNELFKRGCSGVLFKTSCSENFRKVSRKTIMVEFSFTIAAEPLFAGLLKANSTTGVFQGIFRNFQSKTPRNSCFSWSIPSDPLNSFIPMLSSGFSIMQYDPEFFHPTLHPSQPSWYSLIHNPAGIHLFKVNNGNTSIMCDICSKLTIRTPERRRALLRK